MNGRISRGLFRVNGVETNVYHIWRGMRQRCENPDNPKFDRYGGRGISVCHEWQDFLTFRKDMGERPTLDHTIERLDNNGNYEPSNCMWAERVVQMRNQEKTIFVEHEGEIMPMSEVAEITGTKYLQMYSQMHRHGDYKRIPKVTTHLSIDEQREIKWLVSDKNHHPLSIAKAYNISESHVTSIKLGHRCSTLEPKKPTREILLSVPERSARYLLAIETWATVEQTKSVVSPYRQGALSELTNKGWAECDDSKPKRYRATPAAYAAALRAIEGTNK